MTEECKLIPGGVAGDDRGFVRFVNDFDFLGVRRFYQVENHRAGFIRAFHGHAKEAKYVYVPRGAALVVACKMILRGEGLVENLPLPEYSIDPHTLKKWTLNSTTPKVLYIPPGYANGFKTLTDDAILMFFSTSTLEESKSDDIRFDYNIDTAINESIWDEDFR